MWEINITDECATWFSNLSEDEQESVIAVVEILEEDGPSAGRPHVDHIKGSRLQNMKELRPRGPGKTLRILFVFDPYREAILLLGGDKERSWSTWYKAAIPRAEALYEEYLREIGETKGS